MACGQNVQEGTWEQKGNVVTISIDGDPQEFALDGNTLTFSDDDVTMVLEKVD